MIRRAHWHARPTRRAILAALLLACLSQSAALAQKVDLGAVEKRMIALAAQGKPHEAIPLALQFLRGVEAEFGAVHPLVGTACYDLAQLYAEVGHHADAEALYKRSIAVIEKTLGPQHKNLARSVRGLASLYSELARFAEAEAQHRRAIEISEKLAGPVSEEAASSLGGLARVYQLQGRLDEAEPIWKRIIAIDEKVLGPEHRNTSVPLNNLGLIHQQQGRLTEAEALLLRSLAIKEKALGAAHPDVGLASHNLAIVNRLLGRFPEAEKLVERALAIREKTFGPAHYLMAESLMEKANILDNRGRGAEALPVYDHAVAVYEQALGPQHPALALALGNVAIVQRKLGRLDAAVAASRRALAIDEAALGPSHARVAFDLRSLGLQHLDLGKPAEAYELLRRAASIRSTNMARAGGQSDGGSGGADAERTFFNLTTASWRMSESDQGRRPALAAEAFEAAQWAGRDTASAALSQMAARFGAGTDALAAVVRERQDLQRSRRLLDGKLLAAVSASREKRSDAGIAQARAALTAAETRLADLDAKIARDVPGFAELSSPRPLPLADAQKLLQPEEALIVYLTGANDESFVWAATRETSRWARLPAGWEELTDKVARLRRGLDVDDLRAAAARGKLFDLGNAHVLYQSLLEPIADVIGKKPELLIVPSGPLTSLPFHLLVTDRPATAVPDATTLAAYTSAQWLVRRHAVTVLPSVGSLRALRQLARRGGGPKPMIGFGDPVFNRATMAAKPDMGQRVIKPARPVSAYFRGARADAEALRAGLAQLPETADELRAVAKSVEASEDDLRLGAAASETTVKQTDLSRYRIVYFATHGLVSGDLKGLSEPALALTLPAQPSDADDGLLTASEIAQLKLDADWVVLSACNTALGEAPGAPALSGLARAFFYAGARAMLVSHWRVDSAAAVRLTTATFDNLRRNPTIGKAQALRRAMLADIDAAAANPWNAYPDFWGPFSIVGEGRAQDG